MISTVYMSWSKLRANTQFWVFAVTYDHIALTYLQPNTQLNLYKPTQVGIKKTHNTYRVIVVSHITQVSDYVGSTVVSVLPVKIWIFETIIT